MYRVSLITPTYNECHNVRPLAEEIFRVIERSRDIDLEMIIVDDASPDGTGEAAEELGRDLPVKVVHRPKKMGLGSAVMDGFAASDRPILGVMDGDLSHDPVILPDLIHLLSSYDVSIGSRFGTGSSVENWPIHRKLVSRCGVSAAKWIVNSEDPLSGYFVLRGTVVDGLKLTSSGYKILFEILVKGSYKGTVSVPYTFRDRKYSASKLNLKEYILFLKQVIVFIWLKKISGRLEK